MEIKIEEKFEKNIDRNKDIKNDSLKIAWEIDI